MPRLLLLLILLIPLSLTGQQSLSGQLLDDSTGEPIAFATVYIDGTSKGEVTGDDGRFSLDNVALPATLIVSHLNYENIAVAVATIGAPLGIRMKPSEMTLEKVEVKDRSTREQTLAEFRGMLLGIDEWGENARFLNDEVIFFDRDSRERTLEVRNERMRKMLKRRKRPGARWSEDEATYTFEERLNLKAYSKGALEIDLPDLGYILRMDLKQFMADYKAGRRAYLGTFFFTDVTEVKKKHLKNRRKAYLGSVLHFVRSLVAGELATNGFKVVERLERKGGRQPRVVDIDLTEYLVQIDENTWELQGLQGREFSVLYYGDAKQRPLPPWRWKRSQPVQASFIVEANNCVMRKSGALGDASIAFFGYMGDRGLAWALPADYVLEE